MHPNRVLFLHRRSSGSEDPPAAIHGGGSAGGAPPDSAFSETPPPKGGTLRGSGAGIFYCGQDKILTEKRPDLYRAHAFWSNAPKGQELDDHYFGVIRPKIAAFMRDVNAELWKLGVSAKTQHNEVAPAQHELAPIYAECNVAADHNQIIMETLKRVAEEHGLQCLLHEKPFAGVNGPVSTTTGLW